MKKTDVVIIAIGLLVAALFYGGLKVNDYLTMDQKLMVEVFFDGELISELPLEDYGVFEYEHTYGHNIIEINEEGASIIEADCPTLSCVRQHGISQQNENIVCLPHRFHLVVVGNGEVEIDAISQ